MGRAGFRCVLATAQLFSGGGGFTVKTPETFTTVTAHGWSCCPARGLGLFPAHPPSSRLTLVRAPCLCGGAWGGVTVTSGTPAEGSSGDGSGRRGTCHLSVSALTRGHGDLLSCFQWGPRSSISSSSMNSSAGADVTPVSAPSEATSPELGARWPRLDAPAALHGHPHIAWVETGYVRVAPAS